LPTQGESRSDGTIRCSGIVSAQSDEGRIGGTINVMSRFFFYLLCAGILLVGGAGYAQSAALSAHDSVQQQPDKQQPPPNAPAPRSKKSNEEVSSSNDTKIDLSPPPDDANHPGADASSDITEFHVYDPHKADKDVEVGDFYFKRKNYPAAISRYRGALKWKPNDAIATFRLAQALEKVGSLEDARANYQAYLKILPRGPFAEDAKKALQRLTLESQSRSDTSDKDKRR
jgi:tetratricopeptide (TPR) repeat protein